MRGVGSVALALFALGGAYAPAGAQDIEALAEVRGLSLPQGYYDRIRQNPDFFEFPHPWKGQRTQAVDGRVSPVSGQFPLIVIPALFADSQDPLFPASELRRVLFDGPADEGTLTEFYLEASGGLLDVGGVVAPWVRTSLTMTEVVGSAFGLDETGRTGEFLAEAVALVDAEVDFSQFDNDGPDGIPNSGDDDGFVDAVTFEFQEVSASCGGPAIWPHRSALEFWLDGPVATDDLAAGGGPILVNGYLIQSSMDCSGTTLQTAGVISHEFGHVLGLPDLYHAIDGIQPQNRRWIHGCWTLMAAGSWGCGDGSTRGDNFGPTHLSPWSKDRLGWIDWIDVGDVFNEEFVLGPAQQARHALRVPLDDDGREFIVLEYRPQVGFDANLPASGVLMYHWDTDGSTRPDRGSGRPYLFSMMEADRRTDLRLTATNGGNRGEASDAWGRNGSPAFLNSETTPNTRRNEASLPSRVTIHSIVVVGDEARVRVTASRAPGIADVSGLPMGHHFNPYEGRLTIAGGLQPYTASLSPLLPAQGMEVSTDGVDLVVTGAPASMGTFEISVTIQDAQGNSGVATVPLTVGEFTMTQSRALTPFIDNGAVILNDGERSILDSRGNDDGTYDIGDLRAFVLADSGSPR